MAGAQRHADDSDALISAAQSPTTYVADRTAVTRTQAVYAVPLAAGSAYRQTVSASRHAHAPLKLQWLLPAERVENVGSAAPPPEPLHVPSASRSPSQRTLARAARRSTARKSHLPAEARARPATAHGALGAGGAAAIQVQFGPSDKQRGVTLQTHPCSDFDWLSHVRCIASLQAAASATPPARADAADEGDDDANDEEGGDGDAPLRAGPVPGGWVSF
jgi:hypothetical protein